MRRHRIKAIIVLTLTFVFMTGGGHLASAADHEYYRQKVNENLAKGNCDKAQRSYEIWKELTGKSDPDIEARIEACKRGGKSSLVLKNGVLINDVVWASRNVASPGTFAARPEEAGMFYQWNRKRGWSAVSGITSWDSSSLSGDTWTAGNDPCPEGWRVPTDRELKDLVNTASEWTAVNGVDGRRFGSGGNTVFLPAAGFYQSGGGALSSPGVVGSYWSSDSSATTQDFARSLVFYSSLANTNQAACACGFTIRCVGK